MNAAYGTSAVKRSRRTNVEIAEIDAAIYEIAEAERPVTVRGIFYRVLARGLVDKSDKGYRAVQRRTLILRRNRMLPYSWITDGTRLKLKPDTYDSAQQALEITAYTYRRAMWVNQPNYVEIWSEKDAIRGVVWPVTHEFDVPLLIARGFGSETFLERTAADLAEQGKPATIYQLGDHDPSGVAAWADIQRKLRDFVPDSIELTFERLAVTPEQIEQYELPTRPPNPKDSRAKSFTGGAVDVDAIPSTELRRIVRTAVEQWIDPEALRLNEIAERSEKQILRRIAGRWDDEQRNYAEGYLQ